MKPYVTKYNFIISNFFQTSHDKYYIHPFEKVVTLCLQRQQQEVIIKQDNLAI